MRFVCAVNSLDVDKLVDGLPAGVKSGLWQALEQESFVLRYDARTKSAFCFIRQGPGLVMWIWRRVRSYEEAGALLALLIDLDEPLTESLANQVYARATGRQAGSRVRGDTEPN